MSHRAHRPWPAPSPIPSRLREGCARGERQGHSPALRPSASPPAGGRGSRGGKGVSQSAPPVARPLPHPLPPAGGACAWRAAGTFASPAPFCLPSRRREGIEGRERCLAEHTPRGPPLPHPLPPAGGACAWRAAGTFASPAPFFLPSRRREGIEGRERCLAEHPPVAHARRERAGGRPPAHLSLPPDPP